VIVPIDNANETAVGAFNSTNGGASWSAVTTIATIKHHTVAGNLREGPLPSAEIDGTGTVYVAWTDCRFRRACKTNDLVISHSLNSTGTSWSSVSRVPIDATNSGIDHFIPGLAVNKATSGSTAQLGLTYYFYPSGSTQLSVGFISSTNAGSTWSAPQIIISGIPTGWLATTFHRLLALPPPLPPKRTGSPADELLPLRANPVAKVSIGSAQLSRTLEQLVPLVGVDAVAKTPCAFPLAS